MKTCNPKQKVLAILTDLGKIKLDKILIDSHQIYELSRFYLIDSFDFFNNSNIKIFTYDSVAVKGHKIKTFNLNQNLTIFDKERYKNWNKNEIRVLFTSFSLASKVNKTTFDLKTVGYMDGEILKIFSKHFNFTIKFIPQRNENGQGITLSNGTVSGTLGQLEYSHADLDANARIIMDYGTKNTEFLHPIRFMPYVFTIPKKSWKDVNIVAKSFEIFSSKIYILFWLIVLTVPFILYAIDKFYGRHLGQLFNTFLTVLSISFSMTTKLSKRWSSRWILGSLILAFVVMSTLFSSMMVKFFNNINKYQQDVYSIEELVKSNYEIKTIESFASLFENFDSTITAESHIFMHKLIKKAQYEQSIGNENAFIPIDLNEIIKKKKTSLFIPLIMVESLLGKHDEDMTYLKKTPYYYFIAMTIRKQLPMQNGKL